MRSRKIWFKNFIYREERKKLFGSSLANVGHEAKNINSPFPIYVYKLDLFHWLYIYNAMLCVAMVCL